MNRKDHHSGVFLLKQSWEDSLWLEVRDQRKVESGLRAGEGQEYSSWRPVRIYTDWVIISALLPTWTICPSTGKNAGTSGKEMLHTWNSSQFPYRAAISLVTLMVRESPFII